jgi:hypothetical protein
MKKNRRTSDDGGGKARICGTGDSISWGRMQRAWSRPQAVSERKDKTGIKRCKQRRNPGQIFDQGHRLAGNYVFDLGNHGVLRLHVAVLFSLFRGLVKNFLRTFCSPPIIRPR